MLPIALVLLVATNVLAEPSVSNNDTKISSDSIDKAWKVIPPFAVNYYALRLPSTISDLAKQSDRGSQALALAQIIAMIGYYARTSTPGDFCAQINVIKSVTNRNNSGDDEDSTVLDYIETFKTAIDSIVKLRTDPASYKKVEGPTQDVCNDPPEWSIRNFHSYHRYTKKWKVIVKAAWQLIRENADPDSTDLIGKQYNKLESVLTNKDFSYNNFNVAIAVTAASLPNSTSVFEKAFEPLARFVMSIPTKDDIEAAGDAAKDAVSQAATD